MNGSYINGMFKTEKSVFILSNNGIQDIMQKFYGEWKWVIHWEKILNDMKRYEQ